MAKLTFQHAKDNAYLAWVNGVISFQQSELMDISNKNDESNTDVEKPKALMIPTLQPLPEEEVEGHATNFVNELKLSDFKMVLSKHNIASEFQGGVLFCGSGTVALRRHDSGRVTIEGCVSDEYYQVRELLYQQYAIV
jgi:cleavage and polyadenylation specificity factor subunit 2